ncbi:MAG: hypothetical protein V3S40_06970 [Kiloniellales bacterium]
MSGIEDLRQRVTDAEKRFGLINETHAKYGGRLISLMNAIEECIREQQGELAQQKSIVEQHLTENEQHKSTIARKEQDNEQLRTMLHSLLQAIEAGSNDLLADAMRQLDQKASALIDAPVEDETPAEASEDTPEAVEEAPEEPAAEVEIAAEAPEPGMDAEPEPVAEVYGPEMDAEPEPVVEAVEEPETAAVEDATEPAAESEGAVEEVLFAKPNGAAPAPDAGGEPEAEGDSPAAEDEAAAMAETAADADAQAEPPVAEGEDALPEGSLDEIMQRVSKLVEETNDAAAAGEDQAPAEEMASEAPVPEDEIAEDPPLDEAAAS